MKFHVRPYQAGDETRILDLRTAVFGDLDPVRTSLSAWRWQFLENPAGEFFCVLAEDRGAVVGQYAAIPTRFSVRGRENVLAFSCDTMVHPDYRRRGLFVLLARELYRVMAEEHGITAVWGFPNEASLPGFTGHLGWKTLRVLPLWIRPFRPFIWLCRQVPLLKRLVPVGGAREESGLPCRFHNKENGLAITPLPHFHEGFDGIWESRGGAFPMIQIRDRQYLNWRYMGVPEFGYRTFSVKWKGELRGFLVLRMMTVMGHSFGVVVDLFPFPMVDGSVTRRVIDFAGAYCRNRGAEFMTCLFSKANPGFLKHLGFRKVPDLFNPKKWILAGRFERSGDIPDSGADWFISYGDTDIV